MKRKIISFSLGRQYEEVDAVKSKLAEKRIDHITISDSDPKKLTDRLSTIDWPNVGLVELRGCRSWQLVWHKGFSDFLRTLEIITNKNHIPVANPIESFQWVANRGTYLTELEKKGVKIVPTHPFRSAHDVKAQIDEIISGKFGKVIVIKPSVTAGAHNTYFIVLNVPKDGFHMVASPQKKTPEGGAYNSYEYYDKSRLEDFLLTYLDSTKNNFVLQSFIRGKEFSAVSINGKYSYIRKDVGDQKGALVAHEMYGGHNHALKSLPKSATALVQKIESEMPDNLKNNPYNRFDILWDGKTAHLLEIEGGSARLFLNPSDRVDEYVDMLAGRMQSADKPINSQRSRVQKTQSKNASVRVRS